VITRLKVENKMSEKEKGNTKKSSAATTISEETLREEQSKC